MCGRADKTQGDGPPGELLDEVPQREDDAVHELRLFVERERRALRLRRLRLRLRGWGVRTGRGQRGVRRVLVDGDDDARRGVEGVARVRPRGCVSVDGRGLVWFGEDGG